MIVGTGRDEISEILTGKIYGKEMWRELPLRRNNELAAAGALMTHPPERGFLTHRFILSHIEYQPVSLRTGNADRYHPLGAFRLAQKSVTMIRLALQKLHDAASATAAEAAGANVEPGSDQGLGNTLIGRHLDTDTASRRNHHEGMIGVRHA